MKLSIADWYPAHSSNYTRGRNRPVRFITIHHTAANNSTLRHLWQNPARNGSSHFFVHGSRIEQYVDTKDTAWTNGNFASNNECITIEVNGDWRGGFRNQSALNNLERLMREIIKHYPNIGLNYHNDISATLCPGELKSKGLAKAIYDKVKGDNVKPTKANVNRIYRIGGYGKNAPASDQNHWIGRPLDNLLEAVWNSSWNHRTRDRANKYPALERERDQLKTNLAKATEELKQANVRVNQATKTINQKQEEVEVLQDDVANLKTDKKELQAEIKQYDKDIVRLEATIERLQTQIKAEKGELNGWQLIREGIRQLLGIT